MQFHQRIALRAQGHDAVGPVVHAPAGRELHGEAKHRVQQLIVADQSLLRTVAEHHAPQLLQVFVAALARRHHRIFVRLAHHLFQARVVARVGVEGAVVAARLASVPLGLIRGKQFLVFQHADDVDHRLRRIAGAREILCAQAVRFQLVLATVAGRPRLRQGLQQVCAGLVAQPRYQHRTEHRSQPRRGLCALLAHSVARGDVPDLVADHPGEFGLGIQIGHDAARDVDIAAGQREGVDVRAVDHREPPFQLRPMALLRQPHAHLRHVGLQRGIVQRRILLQHVLVGLQAHLDFLRLGHQHEILVPGDRVLRAMTQCQRPGHGGGDTANRLRIHVVHFRGMNKPGLSRIIQ